MANYDSETLVERLRNHRLKNDDLDRVLDEATSSSHPYLLAMSVPLFVNFITLRTGALEIINKEFEELTVDFLLSQRLSFQVKHVLERTDALKLDQNERNLLDKATLALSDIRRSLFLREIDDSLSRLLLQVIVKYHLRNSGGKFPHPRRMLEFLTHKALRGGKIPRAKVYRPTGMGKAGKGRRS